MEPFNRERIVTAEHADYCYVVPEDRDRKVFTVDTQPDLESALADIARRLGCPMDLAEAIRALMNGRLALEELVKALRNCRFQMERFTSRPQEIARREAARVELRQALQEIAEGLGCPRQVTPAATVPAGESIPAGALVEMGDDGHLYQHGTEHG